MTSLKITIKLMGETSRNSNTHPYSVPYCHYFKKEPKINLEVWPTNAVF